MTLNQWSKSSIKKMEYKLMINVIITYCIDIVRDVGYYATLPANKKLNTQVQDAWVLTSME